MSRTRTGRALLNQRLAFLGAGILAASLTPPAHAHETTRASVASSGAEGNSACSPGPALSADGQVVAFTSYASNLFPSDTGHSDTFVHDRSSGLTEVVSVDSGGAPANNDSWNPAISADGMVVAFWSHASNLIAGDVNGSSDIFVHDRSSGITTRVSVDSTGVPGNFNSSYPSISADGQLVAFHSLATNLVAGDTNLKSDIFVHDRSTGITTRVSVDSTGVEGSGDSYYAAISADGAVVAFHSDAADLVAGDANASYDVFVHDRSTGTTTRVSVDSGGAEGNNHSMNAAISADGQIVAYDSWSDDLVASDTNHAQDIFVHDRSTGGTTLVSVDSSGAQGNGHSVTPAISDDGAIVSFTSFAQNLVAGDTNNVDDIFIHERATGLTERLSVNSSDAEAHGPSQEPVCSADGRSIAFLSHAPDLVAGDLNTTWDIFVRKLCADASWENYGAGFPGTNGVPSLTAQADPVLGKTVSIDLADSSGVGTFGLFFIGFQRAKIHSSWGGDLWLAPTITFGTFIPAAGLTIGDTLPDDETLCGLEVDLQAIEADPGATKGVSFTPGLALFLGR